MDTTIEIAPEINETGRAELIEEISTLTGISMVDSATWSCLWFSDMKRLQELVDAFPECAGFKILKKSDDDDDNSTPDTPQTLRKRRIGQILSEEVTSSEVITPSKHSKAVKKLCLEKDQESCIITEEGEPIEVCHILPFAISRPAGQEHFLFWAILSVFWTEDRINEWKRQIFGDDGIEVCQNLLTLCPNAHRLWGQARCALQPLSMREDKKSLKIRFFWLQSRDFTKKMRITARPYLPAILDPGPMHAKLFDAISGAAGVNDEELFDSDDGYDDDDE
ncbi:hypothetical protein DTO271G3_3685 [Paecilomyces variotii]|nr:hypothetical protein DTO271G3_3685 [Paecilomyces variotii]